MASKQNRPTLTTIAKTAGVSVSTVSLALRNDPSIPERTRKKIEKVADKLGYTRDANISRLMSYLRSSPQKRHSPVIAYVHQHDHPDEWNHNCYNHEMWNALNKRAQELGYTIESFWLSEPKGYSYKRLYSILRARGIEGIIFDYIKDQPENINLEEFSSICLNQTRINKVPYRVAVDVCATQFNVLRALYQQNKIKRVGMLVPKRIMKFAYSVFGGVSLFYDLCARPEDRLPIKVYEEDHLINESDLSAYVKEHKPDLLLSYTSTLVEHRDLLANLMKKPVHWAYTDWHPSFEGVAGIAQGRSTVAKVAIDTIDLLIIGNQRGISKDRRVIQTFGDWVDGDSAPFKLILDSTKW